MLQVIYALTGTSAHPPILDGQVERFLSALRTDVEQVIWEASLRGLAGTQELYRLYAANGVAERAALLLSPEGFRAIQWAKSAPSEGSLQQLIEVLRAAPDDAPALYCPIAAAGPAAQPGRLPQAAGRMLLGGTIKVDLDSPFCRRVDLTSPVFFGAFEPFTPDETMRIACKLAAAFAEIEQNVPSFARLIRNYTRKIMIRRNGALPPSSEQVDTEIGAIRLRNVHLDEYTHAQLVDDLIHESVHNFLSTFEHLEFPFLSYGGSNDLDARPVSPWSWRPIRVLPFVHAAFVYFALLHYAHERLRGDLASGERRRFQAARNRYASGFLMPGRLSGHLNGLADVDARALRALDTMQDIVVATHGVGTDLRFLDRAPADGARRPCLAEAS